VSRDNKVWNVSQLSLERTNLAHARLEQEIIGSLYKISHKILFIHKELRMLPMSSAFSARHEISLKAYFLAFLFICAIAVGG
jgi:hypothetical protein